MSPGSIDASISSLHFLSTSLSVICISQGVSVVWGDQNVFKTTSIQMKFNHFWDQDQVFIFSFHIEHWTFWNYFCTHHFTFGRLVSYYIFILSFSYFSNQDFVNFLNYFQFCLSIFKHFYLSIGSIFVNFIFQRYFNNPMNQIKMLQTPVQ